MNVTSRFWEENWVTVTGGSGFLGSFVVEKLKEKGAREIFIRRNKHYDLTRFRDIKHIYDVFKAVSHF